MENRIYLGQTDRGNWEEFGWDLDHEPTPEETGYIEIKAN